MEACLPIVHRPSLFNPIREMRPDGMTVAQLVASVGGLPATFSERGVVTIDRLDGEGSEIVPREMWAHVRPRVGGAVPIEVNFWLPPEGDGVKKILGIVATIALIAATLFITGGGAAIPALGLFAGGSLSAQVLGAAVPVGKSLSTRALQP